MKTRRLLLSLMVLCCRPAASNASEGPPDRGAGATVPWIRYEAEDARSNAMAPPASREYLTPASEAAGRRFVRLEKQGDHVEFTVRQPANGLVIRSSIPDTADGKGQDATLSLLINGTFATKLPLSSRLSWVYGDFPWTNDPQTNRAHAFFDESPCLIPDVVAGDVIRLQIDEGDTAASYLIDFIELEAVAAPLTRPDNSLSIVDFGATANDSSDDAAAFMNCIAAAKKRGQTAWIPAGDFVLDGTFKPLGGVEVRGAGMWHSRLRGAAPMFQGTGEPIRVSDLAIFGAVNRRDDMSPDNAFNGNLGDGSELARLWIEHLKCGVWSTHGTKHLRLHGCRIRNLMADGVNLCDGTTDSVVEQCHLRNTGDDSLATWSPSGDWSSKRPCVRNRFVHNTIENPWHANGIGVYGGSDHRAQDNLVVDTVFSGGGLLISSGHGAIPFQGTIEAEGNLFIRTGGECYIGERNGGLWIHAHESDIEARLVLRNLELVDSAQAAVTIHGPRAVRDITIENALFRGATEPAIQLMPSAVPIAVKTSGIRIEPAEAR
jgi:hypothetical protein